MDEINESNKEAGILIDGIKKQGDAFQRCENLVALLRQLYKKKYNKIAIPPITKRSQIFVAMMFSAETVSVIITLMALNLKKIGRFSFARRWKKEEIPMSDKLDKLRRERDKAERQLRKAVNDDAVMVRPVTVRCTGMGSSRQKEISVTVRQPLP